MQRQQKLQIKKPIYKKWWFWVIAIIVINAIRMNAERRMGEEQNQQTTQTQTQEKQVSNEPKEQEIKIPENQKAFVEAVESVQSEYDQAPNELKKSAIRTKRGKLIKFALNNHRDISGWVGSISDMQTNSEGKAVFAIKLEGTSIELQTWNNIISDSFDETLIAQDSNLYAIISELKKGDRVVVNGTFLPSPKSDFVKESSLTESSSMAEPEFIFRFDSVKLYSSHENTYSHSEENKSWQQMSEVEKGQAVAKKVESNQREGRVGQILNQRTVALSGIVTSISQPEGSGGFQKISFTGNNGKDYWFTCGSTDEIYVRMGEKDIPFGSLIKNTESGKATLYFHSEDYHLLQPKDSSAPICPLGIVYEPLSVPAITKNAAADSIINEEVK